MWQNKKVSLIFPTYNEKGSIRSSINDFLASGFIDEVIVVNNNAAPGTDEEVKQTPARLVYEPVQGFGSAIQRGLREVTGEIIIISEPDGTFSGGDVIKLLAYAGDFDMVLGTRTSKELIWAGAYMNWPLRMGNVLVAKLLELLFNTTQMSDVGCTMRLIHRNGVEKLLPKFKVKLSCFNPEMVMLAKLNGLSFMEIPVSYRMRIGKSMGTKNIFNAIVLGLQMILLIFRVRLLSYFSKEGSY